MISFCLVVPDGIPIFRIVVLKDRKKYEQYSYWDNDFKDLMIKMKLKLRFISRDQIEEKRFYEIVEPFIINNDLNTGYNIFSKEINQYAMIPVEAPF